MDPEEALKNCEKTIALGYFDEAAHHLQDYREWRTSGGFEPKNGDLIALDLERRLSETISETTSSELEWSLSELNFISEGYEKGD
jgi:hypothetical protein